MEEKNKDWTKRRKNTPGTRGGPGGCDRTLAMKRRKNAKKSVFLFVKKEKPEEEKRKRPKAGNNNGQLCIAMPLRLAHAKPPGPILNTIVQGVLG